ncbi:MAG: hypothetical protein PVG39_22655 [Desulfobacteraceae bacterium]|jgi:hypothetical protein
MKRTELFGDLFAADLKSSTIIINVAYVLQTTTYYFILKWLPDVVVSMDFSQSIGVIVLKYTDICDMTGAFIVAGLLIFLRFKK